MTRSNALSVRAKVAVTAVTLGGTAAVVGMGTFGAWTSTTTAQQSTHSSGTVTLDYGDTTTTTNRLNVGATAVAPGDTMQRGFTLRNNGSIGFDAVNLNLTAPTSSALDTDGANGLTIEIEKCSAGWVESLTTPYAYECPTGGTVSTVLAQTSVAAVKTTSPALTNLALTAQSSNSLRATFGLPTSADNSVQDKTSTLSIQFTATQRTGTAK